ncbi:DUF6625 family protein [Rhodoplanes sp. Z2-YC6860]|uniref:DUF6625 family protein n=1 Tax=Rhodoplanes sp. Z2-YC6860 TaxID=674703 RepID=UPI00078E8BA1|nr:DUF6625 family protein [Rhodoplanes sp. Z2-YC6860]AMN43139.1 glycosyl transferase [Rhodoplanes sp. Z2-YC6860]
MQPWLILLCYWFGPWPDWMNFFVESCKWNSGVRWRIHTDCREPENKADNISYVHMSFADYKALVRDRLGIAFDPSDPDKLSDVRPAFGFLHEQDTEGFPFFGWGDLDVVYGDISRFYGPRQFANVDVVSTHPERLSGHFTVLRNIPSLRRAFEEIPDYRGMLESPSQLGVEENQFYQVFLRSRAFRRTSFVERHSTVLSPRGWHDGTMNYPQRWFWRRGHLTNERDGSRDFLYLHFMRWKSTRWINNPPLPGEGAWVGRKFVDADWRRAATEGFCISPAGFTAIGATSAIS